MFMHQDWLMRQIEMMTAAIAKLLFGTDGRESDLTQALEQGQPEKLRQRLTAMLHEGQLGKAEDLLFLQLDETDPDRGMLAVAIDFYQQANALTDGELEAQGFARSELWDGLGEVVARYGLYIPGLWDKP